MKQFLKQVLLFSSIVIIILTAVFIITRKIVLAKTNYKISNSIEKIIIGHSHPECAFNDSLINNFKNISSSGTNYFYNYYTLIPLLNNNKNIKTVFIEFTNNLKDSGMSEKIWGDNYLPFKYKLFGSYIDSEGFSMLFNKNPGGLINGQLMMLSRHLKIIATSKYNFLEGRGGFKRLFRNKLKDSIKLNEENSYKKDTIINISEINLSYLEKMIRFCKSKNVNFFLVRSPLHSVNNGMSDEILFQKILHTRFNNVEFLDFKNYPLTDAEFADLDHLNYYGAGKFSKWFNNLLEKGLLSNNNKQKFINDNMDSKTK
ncbi:MAG: hypothetical protein NTZ59_14470 [Bacteroidetes bacterium]|nr:hypothetical protein [Bacteroidota bacterium]